MPRKNDCCFWGWIHFTGIKTQVVFMGEWVIVVVLTVSQKSVCQFVTSKVNLDERMWCDKLCALCVCACVCVNNVAQALLGFDSPNSALTGERPLSLRSVGRIELVFVTVTRRCGNTCFYVDILSSYRGQDPAFVYVPLKGGSPKNSMCNLMVYQLLIFFWGQK